MPGSSALAASRQSVRHILVDGFWPVPPRCKSYHENRLRYPPAAGIWRQTLVAEGCSSRPFPSSRYRCTRRVCSWDCSCPCPVHLLTRNRSCRRRQRSTGYDLMGGNEHAGAQKPPAESCRDWGEARSGATFVLAAIEHPNVVFWVDIRRCSWTVTDAACEPLAFTR